MMNHFTESIFQDICKQFQKGDCFSHYLSEQITSLDQISSGDQKKEFKTPEELLDAAADYILYKWCLDHKDNRFPKLLDVVIIPIIEPDLSEVSFDDILEILSPNTKRTRV
jgi:hypothetical protein